MFYLQIFGSLGLQKERLESRVVKVCLLEWWTDEVKGY